MKILVLGEHNENEIQQATLCVVAVSYTHLTLPTNTTV